MGSYLHMNFEYGSLFFGSEDAHRDLITRWALEVKGVEKDRWGDPDADFDDLESEWDALFYKLKTDFANKHGIRPDHSFSGSEDYTPVYSIYFARDKAWGSLGHSLEGAEYLLKCQDRPKQVTDDMEKDFEEMCLKLGFPKEDFTVGWYVMGSYG